MEVPRVAELSIEKAWQIAEEDALIMEHLPNRDWNARGVNRDYIWSTICTIRPKYSKLIISEALNKRENIVHWSEADGGLGIN